MSQQPSIRKLLAGRWQMPVVLLALTSAGAALWSMRPPSAPVNLDAVMSDIASLSRDGRFFDATNAAADLLARAMTLTEAQKAALNDYLASAIFNYESNRESPSIDNVKLIAKHLDSAIQQGLPLDATRLYRKARVHEWLGETQQATDEYRARVGMGGAPEELRAARQGLVRVLDDRPDFDAERRATLSALLADDATPDTYVWWALQQEIGHALDCGDHDAALAALQEHGGRLRRSDIAGLHDALLAEIYVAQGRSTEAEPIVRAIDDFLPGTGEEFAEFDQFGSLKSLNRRLSGAVNLAAGKPEEALRDFDDALLRDPPERIYTPAAVGKAQALLAAGRDEEAVEAFEAALARMDQWTHMVDRERGRAAVVHAMEAASEERRSAGKLAGAIHLRRAMLAAIPEADERERLRVAEILAAMLDKQAEESDDATVVAEARRESGKYHEQAAYLADLSEPRVTDHLWAAADQFDRGGLPGDTRRVLERFVIGRSFEPRLPAALLKLGTANEAEGRFEAAIAAYRRLMERYPELPEAAIARVMTAGCLVSLGQERNAEAERLLTDLLEDGDVSPRSFVFRDALRALCDLLYYQGRYAEAVARLETLLAYHGDDPNRAQTQFMLADSYRKSAIAWRSAGSQQTDARERERVTQLSRERLRRAEKLFSDVQLEVTAALAGAPDEDRRQTLRAYQRLSMFYRAECLADLGDDESIEAALAVYRQASAEYEREVAVLSAQVQTANLHLRMGRTAEAARAVERARWLLANMPDAAFESARAEGEPWGRAEWQKYLSTLASSHLFASALATNRP